MGHILSLMPLMADLVHCQVLGQLLRLHEAPLDAGPRHRVHLPIVLDRSGLAGRL